VKGARGITAAGAPLHHSHSASHTLRPFVIGPAPVWALGNAAARAQLRRD
jgi:hypothetical protein